MTDWPTLEYAVSKSGNYAELISPETLSPQHIAPLLLSESVNNELRPIVVNALRTFPKIPKEAYEAVAQTALSQNLILRASGIELVRSGGISQYTVVKLIADATDRLTLEELQQLLGKLGKPYSRIADRGRTVTWLDDTPEHQTILQALHQGGIVSKFPTEPDGSIKVTLKRP